MTENQIVTITFFLHEKLADKWWAFKQMGLLPSKLASIEGIQFAKLLGSGAASGFSIFPNFGVYGFLGVWTNEQMANNFFQKHSIFDAYVNHSKEYITIFLKVAKSHGTWDGIKPFTETCPLNMEDSVAVITRATIRTKYLFQFWQNVPRVSKSVEQQNGRIFSIGIGELPIVQQATFSLWESSKQMMDYAYKSNYHKEVVQKTRDLGWYKEELFARFKPYKRSGSWQNLDFFKLLKM